MSAIYIFLTKKTFRNVIKELFKYRVSFTISYLKFGISKKVIVNKKLKENAQIKLAKVSLRKKCLVLE